MKTEREQKSDEKQAHKGIWGRESAFVAFEESLDHNRTVVVSGPPGVGKRSFALVAAERWAERVTGRRSIEVSEHIAGEQDFWRVLCHAAGVRIAKGTQPFRQRAWETITRSPSCCFVFTDAEACLPDALEWVDGFTQHHFVFSSHTESAESIRLDPLETEHAVSLICHLTRNFATAAWDPGDPTVTDLVTAMDCLPLAIHLAARRAATMTPKQILSHLDERFRLLSGADTTLAAAIGVSFELLSDEAKETLIDGAIFDAPFDLEAIDAILDVEAWTPDLLEELCRHSLLERDLGDDGTLKFFMLRSIRDFVAQVRPPSPEVVERFVEYFGSIAAEWPTAMLDSYLHLRRAIRLAEDPHEKLYAAVEEVSRLKGDEVVRRAVLSQWDVESFLMNIRKGVFAFEEDDLDEALERFMKARELARGIGEINASFAGAVETLRGLGRTTEALALPIPNTPNRRVIAEIAAAAVDASEYEQARKLMVRFMGCGNDSNGAEDVRGFRRAAYVYYYLGNYDEQRRMIEKAVEFSDKIYDPELALLCRVSLADCAYAARDYAGAVEKYAALLPALKRMAKRRLVGVVQGNLGNAYHRLGDFDDARRAYSAAIESHRRLDNKLYERDMLFCFGALEFEAFRFDDASTLFERALEMATESEAPTDIAGLELSLAWCEIATVADDVVGRALRADALFAAIGDQEDGWRCVCLTTKSLSDGSDVPSELTSRLPQFEIEQKIVTSLEAVRSGEKTAVVGNHLYVRMAQSLAAWTNREEATEEKTLNVGPETMWFEYGGERVDLKRRKALRLVLAHLIANREANPGKGSDVYETFEAGWPDEDLHPDTMAERVYWAIRTLRKIGLDDCLETADDGYRLSETTVVYAES